MGGALRSPQTLGLEPAMVSEDLWACRTLSGNPREPRRLGTERAPKHKTVARELADLLVPLRAFARVLIADRSLADSLVREVMSVALANRHAFPHDRDVRVWVFRTLYTSYTAGIVRIAGAGGTPGAPRSGVSRQGGAESAPAVRSGLHRLPVDQRAVLILLEACELSLAEVGAICGCTPSGVKSLARRARERLADMLGLGPACRRGQDFLSISRHQSGDSPLLSSTVPEAETGIAGSLLTRFLSVAGVAVYVLALSTAFPSVKEAGASLSFFAPALAADAAAASGSANGVAPPRDSAEAERIASAAGSVWTADQDGMLMHATDAPAPFRILGAI